MRLAGRVTDWNDEKGFGFAAPNGGRDRAFVHIKDFQTSSRRPSSGDLITYRLVFDERGRPRAMQIRYANHKTNASAAARVPRAAFGVVALAADAGLASVGVIPTLLLTAIVALSAIAYLMYWLDKWAAQRGRQRTAESSLHLVSLAGGWPGALIAQQQFRHKTIKQPFQSVFWGTVVLNVIALCWLVASGFAGRIVQSVGG